MPCRFIRALLMADELLCTCAGIKVQNLKNPYYFWIKNAQLEYSAVIKRQQTGVLRFQCHNDLHIFGLKANNANNDDPK